MACETNTQTHMRASGEARFHTSTLQSSNIRKKIWCHVIFKRLRVERGDAGPGMSNACQGALCLVMCVFGKENAQSWRSSALSTMYLKATIERKDNPSGCVMKQRTCIPREGSYSINAVRRPCCLKEEDNERKVPDTIMLLYVWHRGS